MHGHAPPGPSSRITSQPARRHGGDLAVELGLAGQFRLVDSLRRRLQAETPGAEVATFETHISFVLVAGGLAYKLKKAVNLGFLDFTSLASRHHCCLEELRLNRRLAPALYLDVLPVTGSIDAPSLGGEGQVIDWVVRMRAFDQRGLWDVLVAHAALQPSCIDDLVGQLWTFHRAAGVAGPDSSFGDTRAIRQPVRDSLDALQARLTTADDLARHAELRRWEAAEFTALAPLMAHRLGEGRVRECHGDLHLGNVAQVDGRAMVFDGIDFSVELRWIDVMSELAFMAMDLQAHARADLAHRLVNAYLERSGDYGGARLLPYYQVYRALVRAKVAALRDLRPAAAAVAEDKVQATRSATVDPMRRYLELAWDGARPRRPALLVTHGCSGSGKTTATQSLLETMGAVRIRADVERKRLFGLDAAQHSGSSLNGGLYDSTTTQATYARLCDLAAPALLAGMVVLLDATFLQRGQRDQARALAARHQVPFMLLDFDADVPTLRSRIAARAERGGDASEADLSVLQLQLDSAQALGDDEQAQCHRCRSTDDAGAAFDWTPLLERLGR